MSLFANNSTTKIKIGKNEWVEVKSELSLALKEEYMQSVPKKVEMTRSGNMIVDMASMNVVPYKFLTKVITNWSEDVPVTIENLKNLRSDVLDKILAKLDELYHLNAQQ